MKPFEEKVAIVTGGGSGIGQALCEELARRGSMVFVADVNDGCARQVAAAITQRGGRAYMERLPPTRSCSSRDPDIL